MSRLTPPMDYFTEFVDRQSNYDRFKLMNCIYYHQAVVQYFPYQKAEAYGMLGFCYDRSSNESQAIDSYQKSIQANPNYFWPYFDLGVIYYRKEQYARSIEYFYQAIKQDPVKTIYYLSRSKVYSDVSGDSYDKLEGLKEGRTQAYVLLMDSLYKLHFYPQLEKVAFDGLKEGLGEESIFYYYAGVAAFYQKDLSVAMSLLQNAAQKDPLNADAYYVIGLCLHIAGKDDLAQVYMAKTEELRRQGSSRIQQYLNPRVRFF